MNSPEPDKDQPGPAAPKWAFRWKQFASCLLAWTMLDFALHTLLPENGHIGVQMYLGLGFYTMVVKRIPVPVRRDAFDLPGWFRAFYWAAWWPWYVIRDTLKKR